MALKAVFFDIGETIVSEERIWRAWAKWLGVSDAMVFAALGSVIERRERNHLVFDLFGRKFSSEDEEEMLAEAGVSVQLGAEDIYADVKPCLELLKQDGYLIGVAGNQPRSMGEMLRAQGLPVDLFGTSEEWGVRKPSLGFYRRIEDLTGRSALEIAYVGDRIDYDVVPAKAAGFLSVFVRRGPWAIVESRRPDAAMADIVLDDFARLPAALKAITASD